MGSRDRLGWDEEQWRQAEKRKPGYVYLEPQAAPFRKDPLFILIHVIGFLLVGAWLFYAEAGTSAGHWMGYCINPFIDPHWKPGDSLECSNG